jgi:hypothetical protein
MALGAPVGLLFSFENQKPIMDGAVFEERDDELVLVCSEPFDRLRFMHAVNPNDGTDDFGTSGRVKAPTTVRYLIKNKWLTANQEEGHFTIPRASGRKSSAAECPRHRRRRCRPTPLASPPVEPVTPTDQGAL